METGVFACGFEADGIDFEFEISSICRRKMGVFFWAFVCFGAEEKHVLDAKVLTT